MLESISYIFNLDEDKRDQLMDSMCDRQRHVFPLKERAANLEKAAALQTGHINSLAHETFRLIWGRILDSEKNGEIFSEGAEAKESFHLFGIVLLWSQIKMDQNEDLSSSHPVQQVFTVSQDLRLTSCLRVTQFYKTILNLQRFWDASRMMKTRPLSGKQSRAHHFEPWLKTQGVDSFTSGCSKDLTSRYFKTFSPIERAFSQFPAPSTDWPGCRYYGNSKLSLLYLRSRGWGVLSAFKIRFSNRCEVFP